MLGGQPAPDREFPELTKILKECYKAMEEVSPESLKDLEVPGIFGVGYIQVP